MRKGQGVLAGIIGVFIIALIGIVAIIPTIQSGIDDITTLGFEQNEGHTPGASPEANFSFTTSSVADGIENVHNVTNGTLFGEVTTCGENTGP